MRHKIFFRPDRCMFCLSCVLACKMNSLGIPDVTKTSGKQRPIGRISMTFSRGTPWPWKCQHCASAPCVEACVSGSLVQQDGQDGVAHHPETCVGCGSCLLVCPFSALIYHGEEKRMMKCNLCPDEKIPPCVTACQSKALICKPSDVFASEKKREFAREMGRVREAN
jgi:carbon-monoxide dehydrogenase iron sulfur subunit